MQPILQWVWIINFLLSTGTLQNHVNKTDSQVFSQASSSSWLHDVYIPSSTMPLKLLHWHVQAGNTGKLSLLKLSSCGDCFLPVQARVMFSSFVCGAWFPLLQERPHHSKSSFVLAKVLCIKGRRIEHKAAETFV